MAHHRSGSSAAQERPAATNDAGKKIMGKKRHILVQPA
jgi:hypothetical protein